MIVLKKGLGKNEVRKTTSKEGKKGQTLVQGKRHEG
jgi:hypothetical protein